METKYVERDEAGAITGVFNVPQPGTAEEELPEDRAEIVAFLLPARWLVKKSTIVRRLHEAGLLSMASGVLNADLYTRERWYAPDQPSVYNDAAEALALLQAIGADPEVILARE